MSPFALFCPFGASYRIQCFDPSVICGFNKSRPSRCCSFSSYLAVPSIIQYSGLDGSVFIDVVPLFRHDPPCVSRDFGIHHVMFS